MKLGRLGWRGGAQLGLYLFDIVASLCAGFNEHDIQFLSSLLALLRGDLSAQVEAEEEGGGDGRTDRYGKKCKEDRPGGGREREGERKREKQERSSTHNLALSRGGRERG